MVGTIDDRYLAGDVDFEAAVGEALGTPVSRETMLPLLHALRRGAHPNAQLSDHDAALYDAAGFTEDPLAPAAAAAEREQRMRQLTATAKTVEEAAGLLGVSTSRIRQRAGAGEDLEREAGPRAVADPFRIEMRDLRREVRPEHHRIPKNMAWWLIEARGRARRTGRPGAARLQAGGAQD